jgi:chaperonin cofactor prefoldin
MSEAEDFVERFLSHEYNAQKAHEYYMRTRDLQGRSRGMDGDGSTSKAPIAAQPKKSGPISKQPAKKVAARKPAASKETIEQRRARIAAATAVLKAKLEQLREVLRQLVNEAKVRSGGEATKTGGSTQEPEKATPTGQTPVEKAEEARKAHEYYEKHKNETPEDSIAALQVKIAAIEKKIREKREQIAKRKASAVGAEPKTQ